MKPAVSPRSRNLRFAITPMIDIVFLLIIFFLVATHFVKSETQSPVDLPEATQAEAHDEASADRIVVTVSPDGVYSVGARAITWTDLEAMILRPEQGGGEAEREVRIRGDRQTPYQFIKPILLACAQGNVRKVSFSVLPSSE